MKNIFLRSGTFLETSKKEVPGATPLTKIMRKVLAALNVAYHDPCCDQDTTRLPVSYNTATSKLEYFDNVTGEWEEVIYEVTP